MNIVSQGDIISVAGVAYPMLVTSNDFFNSFSVIIACPITSKSADGPLHIEIHTNKISGTVYCEQMRYFDLGKRGFHKLDRLSYFDTINIADAIQSVFDYHEGGSYI